MRRRAWATSSGCVGPAGSSARRAGTGGDGAPGQGRWWVCAGCARKTSVTAGTIFDNTRTPLVEWFAAAWWVTSQKYGLSAKGLESALGLGSYQTAWMMLHRFRVARRGCLRREPPAVCVRDGQARRDGHDRRVGRLGSGQRPRLRAREDDPLGQRRPAIPAHVSMPGVHRVASLLKRWLQAPTKARSAHNTSTPTCRSSPSALTGAPRPAAGCSSTGSCNRPSSRRPRPTRPPWADTQTAAK